jgi:hypothetical protein
VDYQGQSYVGKKEEKKNSWCSTGLIGMQNIKRFFI